MARSNLGVQLSRRKKNDEVKLIIVFERKEETILKVKNLDIRTLWK